MKPCLKQLQQCIQTISTLHDDEILPANPAALFHWLPKEHMCVLVYLVRFCHPHTRTEGDSDALHAGGILGEGAEVHRPSSHAAGEAEE